MCAWEDDEMGVGLPIQQFEPLTEGIIQTMNYIDYPTQKDQIAKDSMILWNWELLSIRMCIMENWVNLMCVQVYMNN